MSLYGYVRRTTPNLDAFASDAVVFDNAITPWPKTLPAFASIMTGKYPHTAGVTRVTPYQRLGDGHQTLAEILRSHGYDTGAFVSSPVVSRRTNMYQGFEVVEETWRVPGSFAETTRRAIRWLRTRTDKPFFAWVHYNNAHYPYRGAGAPPDLFVDDEHYDGTRRVKLNLDGPLPLDIPADHPYRDQILRPDMGGVHPVAVLQPKPEELDFYIARYDVGIFSGDRMTGVLLGATSDTGLLDDTIVAVVSDHGESLGEHNYYFEHGRLPYDDCLKVPLIIRPVGGVSRGHHAEAAGLPARVQGPVPVFALAPTLLDLAGIAAPPAMEARSFWPVVRGERRSGYVFSESGYQLDYTLSVRDATWKLIHVPNPLDRQLMTGSEYELYNLADDPGEVNNLYESQAEVGARLRGVLEAWAEPWREQAYRFAEIAASPLDAETLNRLRSLGYIP